MSLARVVRFQSPPLAIPRFVPRHGARSGGGRFGRARVRLLDAAEAPESPALSDDLKLFAGTFAAGFLFVSLLIA